MLAMGPRDLNSAPYSPAHCSSHSMTSFQSSELTELPVVENSQLFAQRAHSACTAHGTPPHDMHWTHALDFFALRKGFTGFTGTLRVAVVVAELVAVSVAVGAAVVVLVKVADRLDVDPKKGFERAWRTHSSQITQSSAQSECFC